MERPDVKYIIVNDYKDQAVQNWTFADRKHIVYCNSAEWAMKFDNVDSAKRIKAYLEKNFPNQVLAVVKSIFQPTIRFEPVK